MITALQVSESRLSYPLKFVEIDHSQELFNDRGFKVTTMSLDHKIACYGYRIEEADHPGELQVDKLRQDNIPSGPIYGQLKAGKTVKLDDGRVIDGRNYIGKQQPGRIIAILGDTRQTPNAVVLAHQADVLVHESTFAKNAAKKAHNYYHSTSLQAAEVAKQAGAKKLLLPHISARYTGKAAYQLAYQVRDVVPDTRVVNDFDVIDVPFKK